MMSAQCHSERVIEPIAMARRDGPATAFDRSHLTISFKCLVADGIATSGVAIDEVKLAEAEAMIRANTVYLALVAPPCLDHITPHLSASP
jgi:hypothetical protein